MLYSFVVLLSRVFGLRLIRFEWSEMCRNPNFFERMLDRFKKEGIEITFPVEAGNHIKLPRPTVEAREMPSRSSVGRSYVISPAAYSWFLTQERVKNSGGLVPTVIIINRWTRKINLPMELL